MASIYILVITNPKIRLSLLIFGASASNPLQGFFWFPTSCSFLLQRGLGIRYKRTNIRWWSRKCSVDYSRGILHWILGFKGTNKQIRFWLQITLRRYTVICILRLIILAICWPSICNCFSVAFIFFYIYVLYDRFRTIIIIIRVSIYQVILAYWMHMGRSKNHTR